jgi:hypothetical protein
MQASKPSINVNASANDPANPQTASPTSFLIFFPFVFTLQLPYVTSPSPIKNISFPFFTARIVVPRHSSFASRFPN